MHGDRDDPGAPRERRRSWPIRKYVLGSEPSDDLSGSTTAEERLEMMWPLALEFDEAWRNRVIHRVGSDEVPFLSRRDLARNKRASGRPKDLADLAVLEGGEE